MLTLTREVGEKIVIGDDVVVTVISVSENGRVRLGIERSPDPHRSRRGTGADPPGEPRSWGAVGPPRLCRLCGSPGEREVGIKERGCRRTLTGGGGSPGTLWSEGGSL